MAVKRAMISVLQVERRLTRDTIAAMTDGDVSFRPTDGQMTFGEQALHMISAQETLLDALKTGSWNWDRGTDTTAYPTQTAVLAKFDDMVKAESEYYDSQDEGDFGRSVQTAWGQPETLLQLLVSFLAHEAHHRGQMVTYLRLKGMTPPKY